LAIRHEFEPNAGFRFFKGDVSLLLHAAARYRQNVIATNHDLFKFFQHLNRFLQNVGTYEPERLSTSDIITADHFPDPQDIAFYKYLPDISLDYYHSGSFQFGSIKYYRSIEQQNSKDTMEGLSNIAIKTPKRLLCMSLASGYNFGIFCGTSNLNRRREMSERFGPHIIKIANIRRFAEEVQSLLGATGFYFNHVIYNDLKMFRARTLKSLDLVKTGAPNDNFDPQVFDDAMFDFLYDSTFLPSLFMKPTRFSAEQELRLTFEMSKDVPDVLKITDKNLLKYIEIIQ
jgi:hypothetical protein